MIYIYINWYELGIGNHWHTSAYDSWIATSSNGRCNSRCFWAAEVAAGLPGLALCFAGIWSRRPEHQGHRPALGASMIVRWWDVGNHVLIRCCPGRTGHFCLIDSDIAVTSKVRLWFFDRSNVRPRFGTVLRPSSILIDVHGMTLL